MSVWKYFLLLNVLIVNCTSNELRLKKFLKFNEDYKNVTDALQSVIKLYDSVRVKINYKNTNNQLINNIITQANIKNYEIFNKQRKFIDEFNINIFITNKAIDISKNHFKSILICILMADKINKMKYNYNPYGRIIFIDKLGHIYKGSPNGIIKLTKFTRLQHLKNHKGMKLRYFSFGHTIRPFVIYNNKKSPGLNVMMMIEIGKQLNCKFYRDELQGNFVMQSTTMAANKPGIYIYPHYVSHYSIGVPLASKLPNWLGLIYVFDWKLWMLILASFILTVLSCIGMNTVIRDDNFAILNYLAIFLNQNVSSPEAKPFKIVYSTWVLFSFIIVSAYLSLFFKLLMKPMYEKQIKSLEDLAKSNLSIGSVNDLSYIFNEPGNKIHKQLVKKYFRPLNHSAVFDDVIFYKNVSVFIERTILVARNDISKRRNETGVYMFNVGYLLLSVCFSDSFPVVAQINLYFRRFQEVGLYHKWLKDASMEWNPIVKDRFVPFSFDQLSLPFFIYLVCHVLSILIFIFEVIINKW